LKAFAVHFFIGLLVVVLYAPKCVAGEQAWSINQESATSGKVVVHLNARGVRLDYKSGYSFLMAAPQWKPIAFNDKCKIYFTTSSITEYLEKLTSMVLLDWSHEIDSNSWGKAQACMLDGRPALKFSFRAKKPGGRVKAAECWFAKDIPVAPALSEFTTGYRRVPREPHLLIQYICHLQPGNEDIKVVRTTLCKEVTIPSNTFVAPKGYRLVRDPMQVSMGSDGQEMLDDIIREPIHR